MSFTVFGFWLLVLLCIVGYYLIPQRVRWVWLLVISAVYYAAAGPALLLYLLFAILTTWLGAGYAAKGSKAAVAIPLVLDFGMLAVLKYTGFAVSILGRLTGITFPFQELALPLGISFYTFQSAGYLLDVYWQRCEPERNPAKYALFVGFFPQLMQGPIGRYTSLAPQLYSAHAFDPAAIQRGLWRIVWGLLKKLVVADNAAFYVNRIFGNWESTPQLALQGALLYSVQLYCDFSGGIDVALGIAEMLGIRLDENFRQPFFAVSLTDFWHRWHITLGTWMKDYLFYPISLSGWMGKLRRWCRKRFGRETGRALPVCISNIIVFLAVGIWHGPAWHYIVYGLYNGLIIGISGLLTGTFRKWKKALGVTDQTRWFHIFQIVRTFVIVNISWFLDRSPKLGQAWGMLTHLFSGPLWLINPDDPANPAACMACFLTILVGCLVILAVSVMRERGVDLRGWLIRFPLVLQIAIWILAVFCCALCGKTGEGGFIYANF